MCCAIATGHLVTAAEAQRPLVVATKEAPPFVIKDQDGRYAGLSIELWETVATDLDLQYEYRETTLTQMLEGLSTATFDVAVAALTVTAEREAGIDFTHPFYRSGLGIAVQKGQRPAWLAVLSRLLSWAFVKAVAALFVVLLLFGALIYLVERRRNPQQFGGGAVTGIGHGLWWSAVTMTTVGYGDKAPVTLAGRTLAVIWMFTAVVTVSGFTAAIASSLTVQRLALKVESAEDLPKVKVASIAGSTSESYLRERRIAHRTFESAVEALGALSHGRVDAVVYDAPLLRYLITSGTGSDLLVLPQTLAPQAYAFGLRSGSPLREPINRRLLVHTESTWWQDLTVSYLGK